MSAAGVRPPAPPRTDVLPSARARVEPCPDRRKVRPARQAPRVPSAPSQAPWSGRPPGAGVIWGAA